MHLEQAACPRRHQIRLFFHASSHMLRMQTFALADVWSQLTNLGQQPCEGMHFAVQD
jgi:hypothetical protein